MWDLVKEITRQKGPATKSRGKNQIDGIWSTKEMYCHAAIFIPLWSGIGYKRAGVVDIPYKALIYNPLQIFHDQKEDIYSAKSQILD